MTKYSGTIIGTEHAGKFKSPQPFILETLIESYVKKETGK